MNNLKFVRIVKFVIRKKRFYTLWKKYDEWDYFSRSSGLIYILNILNFKYALNGINYLRAYISNILINNVMDRLLQKKENSPSFLVTLSLIKFGATFTFRSFNFFYEMKIILF